MTWGDRIWRTLSSGALVTFGVLVATKVDRFVFNQALAAYAHIILPYTAIFTLGASGAWVVMTVMRYKFRQTIKNYMGPIYREKLDERDAENSALKQENEELREDLENAVSRLNRILAASKEPLELVAKRRNRR